MAPLIKQHISLGLGCCSDVAKKKKWVGQNYISRSFRGLHFLSLTYLTILSIPVMFLSAQTSEQVLTELKIVIQIPGMLSREILTHCKCWWEIVFSSAITLKLLQKL